MEYVLTQELFLLSKTCHCFVNEPPFSAAYIHMYVLKFSEVFVDLGRIQEMKCFVIYHCAEEKFLLFVRM